MLDFQIHSKQNGMEEVEMAKLTNEQINFLNLHDISKDQTFDATGYTRKEYKEKMKKLNLQVAYGVNPCKKGGHTLRTKYGQCLQCAPLNLTYSMRNTKAGYVYIAYSNSTGYIKIGSTGNYKDRQKSLRGQMYGGVNDWVMSHYIYFSEDREVVERAIKQEFIESKVCGCYYMKDGKYQEADEIYKTSVESIISHLKKIKNHS